MRRETLISDTLKEFEGVLVHRFNPDISLEISFDCVGGISSEYSSMSLIRSVAWCPEDLIVQSVNLAYGAHISSEYLSGIINNFYRDKVVIEKIKKNHEHADISIHCCNKP
jgi:hypothetical protein